MPNFSAFFAFGKRATFSLSYNGREIVDFDSNEVEDPFRIGRKVLALVPLIEAWVNENRGNLSIEQRKVFNSLITNMDLAECPSIEVFGYISEFTLKINRV